MFVVPFAAVPLAVLLVFVVAVVPLAVPLAAEAELADDVVALVEEADEDAELDEADDEDDDAEDELEEDELEESLEDDSLATTVAAALELCPEEAGFMTNMARAPTAATTATAATMGTATDAVLRRGVGLKLLPVVVVVLCRAPAPWVFDTAGRTVAPLAWFAVLSFDTCMAPHLIQKTAPSFNS